MNIENKIKRHGYHLMSLASLGMVCIALIGFILIVMPWLIDWNPQATWKIGSIDWKQAVGMDNTGKGLLSLAAASWTLAYLLPLMALRRLGHCLYRDEALSRSVANAFRWLAHSLPALALLNIVCELLTAIAAGVNKLPNQFGFSFTVNFTNPYLFLIACLCLYSVAHLMKLAAAAADDARSIV